MEPSARRPQISNRQPRSARTRVAWLLLPLVPALLAAGALNAQQPVRVAAVPTQFSATPTNQVQKTVATLPSPTDMNLLDNKHKLVVGDQLSFRILEDEEEPKLLSVMDSGEIEAPYLGRRRAEGGTCRELALKLRTELEQQYYYHATVIISVDRLAKNRGKVYLVGPVRTPGPQEIPTDETFTLSKAILQAGGFTDFANTHRVKVTRPAKPAGGPDQTFMVDVGNILENGKTDADPVLEPGDLIYVPDRLIRF